MQRSIKILAIHTTNVFVSVLGVVQWWFRRQAGLHEHFVIECTETFTCVETEVHKTRS